MIFPPPRDLCPPLYGDQRREHMLCMELYYGNLSGAVSSTYTSRQEIVQEMSSMVQELLLMFYKSTGGFKPHRIIMYRDGISEGQFIHVLQHELTAVREACIKVITAIIFGSICRGGT